MRMGRWGKELACGVTRGIFLLGITALMVGCTERPVEQPSSSRKAQVVENVKQLTDKSTITGAAHDDATVITATDNTLVLDAPTTGVVRLSVLGAQGNASKQFLPAYLSLWSPEKMSTETLVFYPMASPAGIEVARAQHSMRFPLEGELTIVMAGTGEVEKYRAVLRGVVGDPTFPREDVLEETFTSASVHRRSLANFVNMLENAIAGEQNSIITPLVTAFAHYAHSAAQLAHGEKQKIFKEIETLVKTLEDHVEKGAFSPHEFEETRDKILELLSHVE